MKILAFVDTHGSTKSLKIAQAKAKDADIVICAGDLTVFEESLDKHLSNLSKLDKPVLVIHGNHESEESMKKSCSLFKNLVFLHKGVFEYENYLIFGYGGGGFSETDKNFENVAKKFEKTIKDAGKKIEKENKKNKTSKKLKTILVLHAPPYGTKLDHVMGEHAGSKSYRKFIDKVKPTIVICGHLHENAGKDEQVGKTIMINPGPMGAVMEL